MSEGADGEDGGGLGYWRRCDSDAGNKGGCGDGSGEEIAQGALVKEKNWNPSIVWGLIMTTSLKNWMTAKTSAS